MFVERARPRIGRKVMNEGSGRAGSEQRDEEERAQAEESWRGARDGLWGLLPSSVSGKRVGAGVQPQLIQGIRRRDSVGKGQGTTA